MCSIDFIVDFGIQSTAADTNIQIFEDPQIQVFNLTYKGSYCEVESFEFYVSLSYTAAYGYLLNKEAF